ncbi:MAG: hypothetical protein ABEJ60_00180 [Halodesulfurarchaeum sp.]
MAVPPPQGDQDGTEAIAFGIAAVDGRLDETEISFPATTEELEDALGDPALPYDPRGNTIALSTALEEAGQRTFDSRQDLLNALHPVFEAKRSGGDGFGDWLRSILPV